MRKIIIHSHSLSHTHTENLSLTRTLYKFCIDNNSKTQTCIRINNTTAREINKERAH